MKVDNMKGKYMFNTINGVTTPQNVNFKSKNIQKVETTDNIEPAEKDKGLSSTAKWAIALGLAGLASYGIYAMTNGRVKAPKPTPPSPTPANPIPEIKEMAVDIFKKAGKFDKGKAILADGTKYTGNITSTGKDGSKVVMEYVDGILQKTTKTAKDGTKVFDKAYTWAEDGLIKEVKKNGETILDENKLIEIYKKANLQLFKNDSTRLANNHPKVIESLEKIYADVDEIGNKSFSDAIKGRNGLIRSTLRMYGYDVSDKGKIIENVGLENGLVNLRNENKWLNTRLNNPISGSLKLEDKFSGILDLYQSLDNYLTNKSIKDNIAAKKLKNKLAEDLSNLGYLFANKAPVTGEMYEVLGHEAIGSPEIISRPILNFDGTCVSRGKVWLPN